MIAVAVVATVAAVLATAALGAARPPVLKAGNPSGIVFAHGQQGPPPGHGHGSSPDLLYNGGAVMSSGADVVPIFWGSSWQSSPGDKITGLDQFYGGVGGSSYLNTTTEYTQQNANGTLSPVSDAVTYSRNGYLTDYSRAPKKAPSTTDVATEVANTLHANNLEAVPDGYYPVYSDQPRGHNYYCAWHSWGQIDTGQGPVLVQFAFFFNLDNDAGCTPLSNYDTGNGHSQGLRALANVSGHELSEAVTDPHGDAWYDKQGAENADKCAWTFSGNLLSFGGTSWQIQGNWSNSSYDTGSPATYDSGTGCIDSKS